MSWPVCECLRMKRSEMNTMRTHIRTKKAFFSCVSISADKKEVGYWRSVCEKDMFKRERDNSLSKFLDIKNINLYAIRFIVLHTHTHRLHCISILCFLHPPACPTHFSATSKKCQFLIYVPFSFTVVWLYWVKNIENKEREKKKANNNRTQKEISQKHNVRRKSNKLDEIIYWIFDLK